MARIRMRPGIAAAIGFSLLLGAVPAGASAQATGEIGGPPTMSDASLPFPPPHNKKKLFIRARSEPIVIGVGFSAFGKVEIVGQDSDSGLCISIDHPERDATFQTCSRVSVPSRAIVPDLFTWDVPRRPGNALGVLSGFMQPTVASVIAVAHRRNGHQRTRKVVSGTIAVPSPDLLARLHQSTSFGYFATDFRGCTQDTKVRVRAFDAGGLLLRAPRVNLGFPHRFNAAFKPCKPGSSGFAFFGTAPGRGDAAT